MSEPATENRCTDLHPWTKRRCILPSGHAGNHDPEASDVTREMVSRMQERVRQDIDRAVNGWRTDKLLPDVILGVLFAQYMAIAGEAGYAWNDLVRMTQEMLAIALDELQRMPAPGPRENAPGGAG